MASTMGTSSAAGEASAFKPADVKMKNLLRIDQSGNSDWSSREELTNRGFKFTSNGECRLGSFRGSKAYIFEFERKGNGSRGKIMAVRTVGFRDALVASRPIRPDIKKHHAGDGNACVNCGRTNDLVCDHKNDLYNDPRVLDKSTQVLNDFQTLCNSCNLRKRGVSKRTRETRRRVPGTEIPHVKYLQVDFIAGGFDFDPNDPDAMVGTYWHDPDEFRRQATMIFAQRVVAAASNRIVALQVDNARLQADNARYQVALNHMAESALSALKVVNQSRLKMETNAC